MAQSHVGLACALGIACVAAQGALADSCPPEWSAQFSAPGAGVTGSASELFAYDDGSGLRLYMAGNFTGVGGIPASRIARFDGQQWSPVGVGLPGSANDLGAYDFGSGTRLVAAGAGGLAGSSSVAQWDGVQWSAAPGTSPIFTSWSASVGAFQGQLFVSSPVVHSGLNYIGRWTNSSWTGVAQGLASVVWDQLVYDDGSGPALYVAGIPFPQGVPNTWTIARWNGSSWQGVGTGVAGGEGRALTVFDDGDGPALYLGGNFTLSNGQPMKRVARWRDGVWSALGAGFEGTSVTGAVMALQVFDDGSGPALYAAGQFTMSGTTQVNHIAKWNGTAWEPLGLGIGGGSVQSLCVFDDDGPGPIPPALYAVGDFTTAGGLPSPGIARWGRCAPVCPADLNHSGMVDGADLGALLGQWGACEGGNCSADMNADGQVDGADLGVLLGAWGPCG